MSGWIDAVDPRRAEILHTANFFNEGVFKMVFDHGWNSYLAQNPDRNILYEPVNFLGGETTLELIT
jgi:hypothetical protein